MKTRNRKKQWRVYGKWFGGGLWESRQMFATEKDAWAWWEKNRGWAPSKYVSEISDRHNG